MTLKRVRPADSAKSAGPRVDQQRLRHHNGATNSPSPEKLQAPPSPPDDRGEDDWTYFRARPGLTRRLRFPLADEPLDMTDDIGIALVSVRMDRDEFGQPVNRLRAVFFRMGGHT